LINKYLPKKKKIGNNNKKEIYNSNSDEKTEKE
jgi:hypothetical protein